MFTSVSGTMRNLEDQAQPPAEAVVLDRSRHPISRRNIDPDALKVLYRLHRYGFIAYLVGGAVRDLLLYKTPQDFDVGTDARPRQVKKLFRNAYLIGRRFRLAQIHFQGGKIIEVATFRKDPEPEETGSGPAPEADTRFVPGSERGQNLRRETRQEQDSAPETGPAPSRKPAPDRTFGSPREDAFRRDITINALFYDIATFSVIDYTGGLEDLAQKRVRVIGNPGQRYVEDPVRIWRVLRHAARLGFTLEQQTEQAIAVHRHLLAASPVARLFDELNKDMKSGAAKPLFELARRHDLLGCILGQVGEFYQASPEAFQRLSALLAILDRVVSAGVPLTPAEMYGLLFWTWAEKKLTEATGDRSKYVHEALRASRLAAALPKALSTDIIQTLTILDHMRKALVTGRMRWSLCKRAHYPDASRLCSLLSRGEIPGQRDPFNALFRQRFGAVPELERKRKRRRRRRNRRPV